MGRAKDKLHNLETHPPRVVVVGNRRTDNGIDPRALGRAFDQPAHISINNLGLPSANLLTYHGIVKRLNSEGLFGGQRIHTVLLAIDESALEAENSLGYIGLLVGRSALWNLGRYGDWLGVVSQ